MLRQPETINFWVGRLPHWEVVDGRYFVTIHLAGAIPAAGRRRVRDMADRLARLRGRPHDERLRLQRHIFAEMERWLDRADFLPRFRDSRLAETVMEAIEHRNRIGVWQTFEYVVMPNHVHLFFELLSEGLKAALENFKEWTAHRAARLVKLDGRRFWQREWFDHWSRSDDEDERIIRYIQRNPEKAGLVRDFQEWPHGSWRK